MAGTRQKFSRIVVADRDRHLLSELSVMRIIDREMTKVVAGFRTTTAVNMLLLALTRASLLRRFFLVRRSRARAQSGVHSFAQRTELIAAKLGGINRPAGRLAVGDTFVAHQTGINQVYLAVKYRLAPGLSLRRWLSFQQPISETIKLTPDAYVELNTGDRVRAAFLEVDLGTEALKVWQQKTAWYLQLAVSGEFAKRFHQPRFRVLVAVNSEGRLQNIRSSILKSTDKIFWFTTLDNINRDGIWSPIWLRPMGDHRHSLV